MIYDSVLAAASRTPMIRLNRLISDNFAQIFVKFEGLNVGGSIKTRTAINMIEKAEELKLLNKDSIIVEPTSGNQGIGIALVGAVKGYRVEIIMPDSVSVERRKLIKHYGATVELVHDDGDIGECIRRCCELAYEKQSKNKNVFIPNQFENSNNTLAHTNFTGVEILEQVDEKIDCFVSGIGTGGTITGVGHVLKKKWPDIKIVAVEPEKAAILSGGKITTHLQMGIGDGLIPKILDRSIIDEIVTISDEEALHTSRDLAKLEGLLCGISSGSNVAAAIKMAKKFGTGKTVVTILPDTGERYLSTPLFVD